MAAWATESDPDIAHLFLGHHDRVEPATANVKTEPAELADCVFNPLKLLRVLLHQIPGALIAAGFLVTHQGQHDVTGGNHTL